MVDSAKLTVQIDEEAVRQATRVAYQEGLQKGREEVLNWLLQEYVGEDRPDRGTEESDAILELARRAAKHIRSLEGQDTK